MKLALLGSPVHSALSPVIHRAAYAALGLNWTYHAVECRAEDLPRILAAARSGEWGGFSLTMPLKAAVVPFLDDVTDVVVRTGAANTIVVNGDGRLSGENTDVHGMVQTLRAVGITDVSSVTVLGAGATARTALAAARELGCGRAVAVARDNARAQSLATAAARIGTDLVIRPWTDAARCLSADLVISAVPPSAADVLAPMWPAGPGTLMDVTYRPWPSAPAQAAESAGWRVVGGLSMLVHQAARQVTLQTGHSVPPFDTMLDAATAATS
ncbi:shikimate dehydrogenase [Streptomyces corynorhini]|uniref:Shikimate dehydrogenase n=1 Tax=Streptomyces corynorhini TaxID=2282652 RepID=A0A370AWL4_9ACTN|nr:shikimate dehydrogenase [Streptomyces corynorhini]RDG33978.1 shikimate dehydrogenase [Streptomyces corynorhini]